MFFFQSVHDTKTGLYKQISIWCMRFLEYKVHQSPWVLWDDTQEQCFHHWLHDGRHPILFPNPKWIPDWLRCIFHLNVYWRRRWIYKILSEYFRQMMCATCVKISRWCLLWSGGTAESAVILIIMLWVLTIFDNCSLMIAQWPVLNELNFKFIVLRHLCWHLLDAVTQTDVMSAMCISRVSSGLNLLFALICKSAFGLGGFLFHLLCTLAQLREAALNDYVSLCVAVMKHYINSCTVYSFSILTNQ